MRYIYFLIFTTLFALNLNSQEKKIFVYDLVNGTIDSIPPVSYDTNISNETTPFFTGHFNTLISSLEQTPPINNVYPNTSFTLKKQASTDYDLDRFPIRTSVKLFSAKNDSLTGLCSGNMISRKHVITAAHCVSYIQTNVLISDSILVSPVFDNGTFNPNFNSSYVTKVYIFKDWTIPGEDIAILELNQEIGVSTGWLSIGFQKDDNLLKDGLFYKFTYPGTTLLIIDPNPYNGDTLYYNYGIVDSVSHNAIRITGTSGIPGESGSSIIKVENNQSYTSYGVLSLSNGLTHSRISNRHFYAFKNIISDDLTHVSSLGTESPKASIYPNPATSTLQIKLPHSKAIISLKIFNNLGKQILAFEGTQFSEIDISTLSHGVYYLRITTDSFIETHRFIKN